LEREVKEGWYQGFLPEGLARLINNSNYTAHTAKLIIILMGGAESKPLQQTEPVTLQEATSDKPKQSLSQMKTSKPIEKLMPKLFKE